MAQEAFESSVSGSGSSSASSVDNGLIGNKYRKLEDLGVGGYSRVILATHINTNQFVAVKILLSEPKQILNPSTQKPERIEWEIGASKTKQCKREMALMREIEHENVVKLVDFIENATFPGRDEVKNAFVPTPCLCVVLEYCSRGELFDYLMYAGGLGSRVTRTYFHQFLNGLQAMHDAGYVHRDLKPENLLLDDEFNLKIADFGFATPFKDQDAKIQLTTTCGTRGYLAPELIRGEKYNDKVDLFAMGIIMFTTFAGFPPFQHAGRGDWWWDKMEKAWAYWQQASQITDDSDAAKLKKKERIEKGNAKMKLFWSAHERSCKFSDTFKHLMQYLLNPNPKIRYDISQCREHSWLKGKTLSGRQLRRTMKKLNDKVTKQRALKIQEQLKQRDMVPQSNMPANQYRAQFGEKLDPKHPCYQKQSLWVPMLLNSAQNAELMQQSVAVLRKVRFQFYTRRALADVLHVIDQAALDLQMTVETEDHRRGEIMIKGSLSRIKDTNPRDKKPINFEVPETVRCKIKIMYEKAVMQGMGDDAEDEKSDDEDAFDTDSEIDEANGKGRGKRSRRNKADQNGANGATAHKADRWIVAFWRVDGSADGFQQLIGKMFYSEQMNDLMDLSVLDDVTSEQKKELQRMDTTPQIYQNLFDATQAKYLELMEAEDDANPEPLD